VRERLRDDPRPLVLDSFCGTGMSTAQLAERFADSLVIGIDKSAHRLGKHRHSGRDNYLLVQADCGDFWRLAAAAGWRPARHFLLYPNPWPKPAQLKRRVHGSADFPTLLELGGEVELRSNWRVYVEEFAAALRIGGQDVTLEGFTPTQPLTLFERKYLQSGHGLWRCRCMVVHNSAKAGAR
jgi:tRNA G46 methylase TrmB